MAYGIYMSSQILSFSFSFSFSSVFDTTRYKKHISIIETSETSYNCTSKEALVIYCLWIHRKRRCHFCGVLSAFSCVSLFIFMAIHSIITKNMMKQLLKKLTKQIKVRN